MPAVTGLRPSMALLRVLLLAASGCTALVDPENAVVRCEVDGRFDPCQDLGMSCIGGVCSTCDGEERCAGAHLHIRAGFSATWLEAARASWFDLPSTKLSKV